MEEATTFATAVSPHQTLESRYLVSQSPNAIPWLQRTLSCSLTVSVRWSHPERDICPLRSTFVGVWRTTTVDSESIQLLSEFEEMRNIEKISGEVILDDSNEFSNLETLQMMK